MCVALCGGGGGGGGVVRVCSTAVRNNEVNGERIRMRLYFYCAAQRMMFFLSDGRCCQIRRKRQSKQMQNGDLHLGMDTIFELVTSVIRKRIVSHSQTLMMLALGLQKLREY